MIDDRRYVFWLSLLLLLLIPGMAAAQESTVYAAVVATKMFVVGAANPRTGIHFQHPSADTAWQHTGPNNIRAFGVAVGPGSRQQVLYIASGNGLQKSSDGGATWKITTGWNITEVQSVSPDPRDPNRVYIATPYGVFRTTDGCATWKECNRGLVAKFTPHVLASPLVDKEVYCVTEDGAYVSMDGADTWTRMGLNVGNVRTIAQHPRNPQILAVGTENHGMYMSTNGGRWWTRRESGVDHLTFYAVAFDPVAPDTMYAGGYVTGIYRSTDAGQSWKRMNRGLNALTFRAIAVDPRDSRRVFAGAYWGGVYRSENGGEEWKPVGPPDSQIWTIVIHP
jgi:photosystem II stability/assembly factor-like uncharacterized protein